MSDQISVEGLRIYARVGVSRHETLREQPLVVSLNLFTNVAEAALKDDLSKTIDYVRAAEVVREVAKDGHHRLIETLAEQIATALLQLWPEQLLSVRVRIEKPEALDGARTVAVELIRSPKRTVIGSG